MKYFSLFSGVEGIGQGLDGKPIGFSEIDKYASMVLKYHFPNVRNYGDCTKINYDEVPDFDVLVGGSPCQDFSIAGKRKGLGGARSSLAWEFIRCLRCKKPRSFIWENVKGVLSSRSGWDFANLLCAFSESGYDLWWQILNAKDFGVPQNRERIFVIGVRGGSPKEIFFKRQNSQKNPVIPTLTARYYGGQANGAYIRNKSQQKNLEYVGAIMSEQNKKWLNDGKQLSRNFSQGQRVYSSDGIATTLASQAGGLGHKTGLYAVPLKFLERNQKNFQGEYSFAVDTANTGEIRQGQKIRRLTPAECERLMSWPDDWTKWGINEKGEKVEMSDSQRYKMCGNGVVSAVVREIQQVMNF